MRIPIFGVRLFSLELLVKIIVIRIKYLIPWIQFFLGVLGASFIIWLLLRLLESFKETGIF